MRENGNNKYVIVHTSKVSINEISAVTVDFTNQTCYTQTGRKNS